MSVNDYDLYAPTDHGIHGTLCYRVGTNLADYHRHKILEVRRLVGTTSTGARRHTLGMSAVLNDAATASRPLPEVDRSRRRCSSDVQATPLAIILFFNIGRMRCIACGSPVSGFLPQI